MKSEGRASFINRSFRRSFRRKKVEEKTPEQIEEERKNALTELKNAVKDVTQPEHDDVCFNRILKAKDYDVKESEKLFRLMVNTFKLIGIRQFNEDRDLPQVLKENGLGGTLGFDKKGHLVRFVSVGNLDLKGFVHTLNTLDLFKCLLYYIEKDAKTQKEENSKTGRNNFQFTFIIDMDNFSPSQILYKPVLETIFVALKFQRDFYCDISKDVFVINAPSYFPATYKIIKPALSDHLQKTVKILDDNWRNVLLGHIDADVLPAFLGGTRVDSKGDPKCSEFLSFPTEISSSFYSPPNSFLDESDPDVKTIAIPPGSSVNIPIFVDDLPIYLECSLMSKEHDVAVGLFYDPEGQAGQDGQKDVEKMEMVVPIVRSQCNLRPIVSSFEPWRKGLHILHLDNSYSWMAPKQILYKITLVAVRN